METGSKIDRLVIGARGLKDHLGWYLLQGLVASVFLHSAVMTLVGMWPSGDKSRGREIVIIVDNPPKRQPDSPVNPVPERPKPKPPLKPDIKGLIPVDDEPMVIDTLEKPSEDYPPLTGNLLEDGTIDTGAIDGGGFGNIDTSVDFAGTVPPWQKFVPHEFEPVALTDINRQPEYPEMAQRAGVGGTVNVWLHISDKGDVIGWQIVNVRPAGLGFEDAVARVVPKWKFTPAIQQNNPVAVWVHVPIKFRVSN